MNREEIGAPQTNLFEVVDNMLNGLLVVEDHQGLPAILDCNVFTITNQTFCLQDIVGVALHAR